MLGMTSTQPEDLSFIFSKFGTSSNLGCFRLFSGFA
jgi:hypothetical protein